jgi:hypothetical protein
MIQDACAFIHYVRIWITDAAKLPKTTREINLSGIVRNPLHLEYLDGMYALAAARAPQTA